MGRWDAEPVKGLDPMHIITPLLYPNRCDNEAYISEKIDLTNINRYLEEKNASLEKENGDVFKYTIFHLIVTAILKTVRLRPKLNRFIANNRIYQRHDVTAAFVVKKKFSDSSDEALAVLKGEGSDTIDSIHEKIRKQVYSCRSDVLDDSTKAMDIVSKLPFFIVRFVVWICRILDRYGKVPKAVIKSDPFYCTAVLSNLGSIKLRSGYHHLTNWGTNSLFVVIGEKSTRPAFKEDGTYEMREFVDLGITVDERIADGYYYSKSVKIIKKLLENPWLLDRPLDETID
ncbi:MAG: 2-oxo acid dehydrogenase subunit E2 [Firmicutes bacterium]|nr:2-oxo acid dehydrogenase subunit E2 [Bacillota bacterium]